MIDLETAKKLTLEAAIEDLGRPLPFEIGINVKYIKESDHGWIIPWNTQEFLETGNIMKVVAPGLGRIGITKSGKTVHFMSGYNDEACFKELKEKN